MVVTIEVPLEGLPDGTLAVSGADDVLGGWDLGRVVRFDMEASESRLVGRIDVPSENSEFKLVVLEAGGGAQWEPLAENRRFPSRLHAGAILRMSFGNPRMGIEASNEHIDANARATRKMEARRGSALQDNVDSKGENAYYFAHTRNFEVPEHAKVISGPGLITGGAPVLIEAGAEIASEADRTVQLKDYSWSDSTNKVKVYVPIPEGMLPPENADDIVHTEYQTSQVELTINCKPRQRLKIEKLNGELNVDACTTRVEAHKNRIVLQLAKKRETTWYNLTKK